MVEEEELTLDAIIDAIPLLPPSAIANLCLTCAELYAIVNYDGIWKRIYENNYGVKKFKPEVNWWTNIVLIKQRIYRMNEQQILVFALSHDLEKLLKAQLGTDLTNKELFRLIEAGKRYDSNLCINLLRAEMYKRIDLGQ